MNNSWQDAEYYNELQTMVLQYDIMVDKLIIKVLSVYICKN